MGHYLVGSAPRRSPLFGAVVLPINNRCLCSASNFAMRWQRIAKHTSGKLSVPAVVTCRKLAKGLRMKPEEVVRLAGGVRANRKFHIPIDGVEVTFHNMGDILFPFHIASDVAKRRGIEVSEQRVEPCEWTRDTALSYLESLSEDERNKLPLKIPTAVVMGHVDHGKTTLLSSLLDLGSSLLSKEAGSITQKLSVFQTAPVRSDDEDKEDRVTSPVTFIDTPGHSAFVRMRHVAFDAADVVVLVIAGDEGLQPQTYEVLEAIFENNVPMVVALNKMDLPNSVTPEGMRDQLEELARTMGKSMGKSQVVPVSALHGDGLNDLMRCLNSTVQSTGLREISSPPRNLYGKAQAMIVEIHREHGLGLVLTAVVLCGTAAVGDSGTVGTAVGRIRTMKIQNQPVNTAGPGTPLSISGFRSDSGLIRPGDILTLTDEAKDIQEHRLQVSKFHSLLSEARMEHELVDGDEVDNTEQQSAEHEPYLPIVLKAECVGTLHMLLDSIEELDIGVAVVHCGIGKVNETDLVHVEAEGGLRECPLVLFNVPCPKLKPKDTEMVLQHSIFHELIGELEELAAARV